MSTIRRESQNRVVLLSTQEPLKSAWVSVFNSWRMKSTIFPGSLQSSLEFFCILFFDGWNAIPREEGGGQGAVFPILYV